MTQQLFTEYRSLYSSSREHPQIIRLRIRMRDLIDPEVVETAVQTTMKRYPYFCVELKRNDTGEWTAVPNPRLVTVHHSDLGVDLNAPESNYHIIAFSWYDNWITMDISHAITDGTGAYEVMRTFLYYYCTERYQVTLPEKGIRLAGDEIPEEEWSDPVASAENLPVPNRTEISKALNLLQDGLIQNDHRNTVYSISIPESEFMRFNIDHDGSPATMVSLFLSRAVAKLFPDSSDTIRITMCVNERNALHAPLAHQSLVGGAMLEYKDRIRSWPVDRQATAYRGMVYAQTTEEAVLSGVASQKGLTQLILSKATDQERMAIAASLGQMAGRILTATVSYVGKAEYKGAEQYIRDFRSWTYSTGSPVLIEIAAVNGKFYLDVIQMFSSAIVVEALLKEFEENGIAYDLQDVRKLQLPNLRLPWSDYYSGN